jgi:hypothetical protein
MKNRFYCYSYNINKKYYINKQGDSICTFNYDYL